MRYKDAADRLTATPSLAVDANATLGAHSLAVVAHPRPTRGKGVVLWKYGFRDYIESYRSQAKKKEWGARALSKARGTHPLT
jgi:hypothetical protein